ncbi:MAG TPA: FAD-dependent oxidoreductase [Oceanospirillaceae bacterium]|nr:FAD-dependent oxidoreductase [Oceanospirillaceae bacterium]
MKPNTNKRPFADPQCLAASDDWRLAKTCAKQRLAELKTQYAASGFFDKVSRSQAAVQVFDGEFGSGLDFLLTWQWWNTVNSGGSLIYLAICEQPLTLDQLRQTQKQWPQLNNQSLALQAQYPGPIKGFYQLDFGEVKLILVQAPRAEAITQISAEFDVCLNQCTPNSQTQKLFATYLHPWQRPNKSMAQGSRVAVIGGGISGTATAYSLSRRGFDVTIIEQGQSLASGASGNRQGMLYAKLPDNATVAGQFHQQGLQHSMALLKRSLNSAHWRACGLLQLAKSPREQLQMQTVMAREYPSSWLQYFSLDDAQAIAKQPLAAGGLFFPASGWVSPAHWCLALFEHSRARLWSGSQVQALTQDDGWQVQVQGDHQGVHHFDAVVLANANDAKTLVPQHQLALKSIRGQVSYVQAQQGPDVVVCGEGYVTPAQSGVLAAGASYNLHTDDVGLSEQDHLDNLQRMADVLPQASNRDLSDVQGGRVGFRSVTPDYLPMVGQIADENTVIERFGKLRKDANYKFQQAMPYLHGLYINAGHGSKGLISAPLSAEILASQMANQALPVAQCVAWGLDPNRFLIRDLIRRKR